MVGAGLSAGEQVQAEAGGGKGTAWVWRAALPIFLIALVFLANIQYTTPNIAGVDAYFHIKLAYLTRIQGPILDFPWAPLSIWRDRFDDKAFLYHLLLTPFTFGDLVSGAKWAAVFFGALLLTSFFVILGLNRVRYPAFWFLLLLASGHWFLFRINTARPQGWSVLLALWTVHFLINRRPRAAALVTFLYTLSYSIALPFALACAQAVVSRLVWRRAEWRLAAIILFAFLIGMLVSPYFPKNLYGFLYPNVIIPYFASGAGKALGMGMEFLPITTRQLLLDCAPVVAVYFAAFFTALAFPREHSRRTLLAFVFAHALLIPTLAMKRFIEYSMPLTVLFLGMYFNAYAREWDLRAFARKRPCGAFCAAAALAAALGLGLWYSHAGCVKSFRHWPATYKRAALELKKRTAPGEFVYTCDWDDTPQLFFFNHHNRYPVFLDPTFIFRWSPDAWARWKDIAHGVQGPNTGRLLRGVARYGVCSSDFGSLQAVVRKSPDMRIVYEDDNAFVFKVLDDPRTAQPVGREGSPAQ